MPTNTDADRLKVLKIIDLKNILTQASVHAPSKANKADLITRILASKPALDAFNNLYPAPQDDLLAPPEDVDWNVDAKPTAPAAAPIAKPTIASLPSPTTEPATTETPSPVLATSTPADPTPSVDPELEKRKQRAERFGIPLVEPKARKTRKAPAGVDEEKLKARAARFGIATATTSAGQKRAAPKEQVDPDEAERRKKRAERFGTKAA